MAATPSRGHAGMHRSASAVGRATRNAGAHLETVFGGPERTRVIVVLAGVLALSSADAATVGAAAIPLIKGLKINNTDIGLLVTASSIVAAVASVPFGVLADKVKRTRTLAFSVVFWGVAMLWSATAPNFGRLLLSRLFLGVVTAAAGPIVASLVGDFFPSHERGRVYSYILTGELVGAGIGFAITGDVAALSWRAAFVILALPTFVLAWFLMKLPEPARGGRAPLPHRGEARAGTPSPGAAGGRPSGWAAQAPAPADSWDPLRYDPDNYEGSRYVGPGQLPPGEVVEGPVQETDAQRLAKEKGIAPDPDRVLRTDPQRMGLWTAARYLLGIRSNVVLIVASACVYFYLSGVTTFGVEFASKQYSVPQALANGLILLVGVGAVFGVMVGGDLSDRLLRRRFLGARVALPAVAALVTAACFVPAIFTRNTLTALPYLTLAGFALTAQNPPIDAARLDIVPPLLWGRAEGIRTMLRTLAQSLAPVLFGLVSEAFGGKRVGLQWAFGIFLVPLFANGVILLFALRSYPRDVATAAAAPPPGAR